MNIRIIGGAVAAAIAAIGVFALGGGDNAVSVSQSAAQTPGTCEAMEDRDLRQQCIAVAECFGTDYKTSWEVVGGKCTDSRPPRICVAYKASKDVSIKVNCETGAVE